MGEAIPCKGDKEPFALKGCPLGECKAPESWQVLMGKIWRAFFFGGVGVGVGDVFGCCELKFL